MSVLTLLFFIILNIYSIQSFINISCEYLDKNKQFMMENKAQFYLIDKYTSIKDLKFSCINQTLNISTIELMFELITQKRIIFDSAIDFNYLLINSNIKLSLRIGNLKGFNLQTTIYENVFKKKKVKY